MAKIGVNDDTGNFLDMSGVSQALNEANHYEFDPTVTYTDPESEGTPRWDDSVIGEGDDSPSFLDTLVDNFLDSITNTGTASALQLMWGKIAHTENAFQSRKLMPSDIEYVKNALADDEDAQNYVLSHAIDPENARWLVNQKLVDKRRREEVAQWRAGNQSTVDRFLMGTAGVAGLLLDPINLIPVGKAIQGLKLAGRLGEGLTNLAKAKEIARYATEVGAVNSATVLTDDYLRDKAGGQKVDYGFDAAVGFLVGATLGATGGLFKAFGRGGEAAEQAGKLDVLETRAYEDAADVGSKVEGKVDDTFSEVAKHHQVDFADAVKSKMYDSLVANKRVIAAPSSAIRQIVMDRSGIMVPENARALYVPNEDYAVLFTDKLKPHEVESVLIHEFGVHAGLQKAMGDKAYTRLMNNVSKWASREGSVFHEARQNADTYDPEEILAKVIEDKKLDDRGWNVLKQSMNKVLRKEGSSIQLNMKQVKAIMEEQATLQKSPNGYYVNADGSTSFAGIRYSKDNIVNPENLARYIELEQNITRNTQSGVFNHLPDIIANPLRKISKGLEQGIFGQGINSLSNTERKYTTQIWQDARGRGLGNVDTITAEENKFRLMNILIHSYAQYGKTRASWCFKNRHIGAAGQAMFDKMVTNAYNAKYAFNKANVIEDLPEEVLKAVEQLKAFREKMIELGKRSADDVGAKTDNLIDKDWYAVDDELHRQIDRDLLIKLSNHFNKKEELIDFLEDYIRKGITKDKFEIIRQKMERSIVLENKKIERANNNIPEGSSRNPQELTPVKVTDDEVQQYIDDNARGVAEGWSQGSFDPADPSNLGNLGNLDFLKVRMPLDTTHIMKLPDGTDFSFDNNLRDYDMDSHVLKNINRFAGEAALRNVFANQKALDAFLEKVKGELDVAKEYHKTNKASAKSDYKNLVHAIAEFRGTRPPDEIGMGRMSAVAKILRNLAYAKNGANMGFNQIGEAGGTIAYGGASQLFHVFPPLGRFVERVKMGKVSSQTLRDADDYIFGSPLENEIWTMNWGDRAIRDALTTDSLLDRGITFVGDMTANLGKITSTVNFLPKMTDAMIRGLRTQTMMDSIRAAYGEKVGNKFRQPFSKAKLKAAHISSEDFMAIKENLKKYTTMKDGQVTTFDYRGWQKDDPHTFMKWYGLIQNQAERGLISSTKLGNKNLLKNSSPLWQMFFQFKDYNLRAINAQTFRAMTAGDLDDAMATGLSVVMNMAAYAGRVGLTVGALKASGADKKAQDYYNQMFAPDTLQRAAATRSTILGSPLSFANDFYEAAMGATSVRTTVDRTKKKQKERTASDILGDMIAQLPAVREGANYTLNVIHAFNHATEDKFTKRDFSNMMRLLPIPNMIPFYSYTNSLVEHSNLRK